MSSKQVAKQDATDIHLISDMVDAADQQKAEIYEDTTRQIIDNSVRPQSNEVLEEKSEHKLEEVDDQSAKILQQRLAYINVNEAENDEAEQKLDGNDVNLKYLLKKIKFIGRVYKALSKDVEQDFDNAFLNLLGHLVEYFNIEDKMEEAKNDLAYYYYHSDLMLDELLDRLRIVEFKKTALEAKLEANYNRNEMMSATPLELLNDIAVRKLALEQQLKEAYYYTHELIEKQKGEMQILEYQKQAAENQFREIYSDTMDNIIKLMEQLYQVKFKSEAMVQLLAGNNCHAEKQLAEKYYAAKQHLSKLSDNLPTFEFAKINLAYQLEGINNQTAANCESFYEHLVKIRFGTREIGKQLRKEYDHNKETFRKMEEHVNRIAVVENALEKRLVKNFNQSL